jgi:phosphoribosylformimino-5-aminoimidazole carboxamide ribotide isomerase
LLIFPAIDIKGGECVRLFRGDFATAERVADDYMQTAQAFSAAGCAWIHMVDLNGALEGKRVNKDVFTRVANETSLKVELGGGIRSLADAAYYLRLGIERVIFGSVAIEKPELVGEAVRAFGSAHVAVGIDAKNGLAAAHGWLDVSAIPYIELARRVEQLGVETIIFTDIGRDGMLQGPNLEQLIALNEAVGCNVIASGGVTNIGDIQALKNARIYGAICGRSIYAGTLSLQEAVDLAHKEEDTQ